MDDVIQHQSTTLSLLSQSIQSKIQLANQDLHTIVNSHPFFVLFEPRLGCNAQSDHTVSRSVLPVFKTDFQELFASLQCQILKELEPIIITLVQNTELSWKGENGKIMKKYKEIDFTAELQKRKLVEQEQIIKDIQLQKDTIQKKLQSEILALREMLFQSKRIGTIYKPDYDGFQQKQETKDTFSKKEHDDIVAEILSKNANLQKKLEEKNRSELQQMLQQTQNAQKDNQALRERIQQLESELERLNSRFESEMQGNSSEYEHLILSLQTQLADLQQKLKSAVGRYEDLLEERDAKIADLEALISRLKALQTLSKDDLERQRKELENAQKGQKDQKERNSPEFLKEIDFLRSEIRRLEGNLEEAERQKAYVQEAFDALKAAENGAKGSENDAQTFESSVSQDIKDLQNLLRLGKSEYEALKATSNSIFHSLFDLEKGGITRFAQFQDKRHSPYEQLRSDMKKQKIAPEQLKPLAKSLSLLKNWCLQFCPDAESAKTEDFDFDNLAGQYEKRSEMDRKPTPGAVNSVLLHPSVQQTERLQMGANCEIGINTSICASLDDGPVGMAILVDKSVMYECERCSSSRSGRNSILGGSQNFGSRPGSAQLGGANQLQRSYNSGCNGDYGSGRQNQNINGNIIKQSNQSGRENLNTNQHIIDQVNQTDHFSQRPSSGIALLDDGFQRRPGGKSEHLNNSQTTRTTNDDLQFSGDGQRPNSSLYACPECNKSGRISRIEIVGSDGNVAALNVSGACGDCNQRTSRPEIACHGCLKSGKIGAIGVFAEAENEDEIEYFGEDDWEVKGKGTENRNGNSRPGSGIARNGDMHAAQMARDIVLSPGDGETLRDLGNGNNGYKQNGADSRNMLTYNCPHCQKITPIGAINLESNLLQNAVGYPTFVFEDAEVIPGVNRITSAPNYAQPKYDPHHRVLSAHKSKITKIETQGVFDRLILRARELEVRFNRKRDLILQERKRTTERVLRSLSLFIENFPSPERGLFSVKEARSQLTQSKLQKASQIVHFQNSSVSMKFNSPVKRAFGRPVSSKVDDLEISQLATKSGFRQRPMSGGSQRVGSGKSNARQDGIMQLLAASGVLKK
ncbi:hypothetical protein SS50377_25108 [Spironucleus salmonicida]|uniref:Uncharacterized protein n=1 Tax=Spironucleus salmonicida TaxID=348837 RepID=V6LV97_9EUKA|nr:hypothetical protein SS50377_25108 [Spironucleus salmonicida]|eukprot:EST44709.1 hypothetical protein SS50377_15421 [Spironucleus salmonicida]